MKTFLRIIILGFALLFLGASLNASPTGTLNISGSVSASSSVTITPANADALVLTTNVSNLLIATVVEKSNSKAGYTLTLTTTNGGVFKNAGTADSLAYTLTYNGNAVSFSGSSATVSDISSRSVLNGASKELKISFSGADTFLEVVGSSTVYSDILTFTIAAK